MLNKRGLALALAVCLCLGLKVLFERQQETEQDLIQTELEVKSPAFTISLPAEVAKSLREEEFSSLKPLTSSPSPNGTSSPSQNGTSSEPATPFRVICVAVQNEGAFLKEWIIFHLNSGWTKIHLYDDQSVDGTKELVQSLFSPEQVEWEAMRPKLPNTYFGYFLHGVYGQCVDKYWTKAEAIACLDVDEYVFPAKFPPVNVRDPLMETFEQMGYSNVSGVATVAGLDCLHFGINGHRTNPAQVVPSYPKRSPYKDEEPCIAPEIREFCKGFPPCAWGPHPKKIYFPNGQKESIKPGVHDVAGGTYRRVEAGLRNKNGLNCNHYVFRSYEQIRIKAAKNGNDQHRSIGALAFDHPFHNVLSCVEDLTSLDWFRLYIEPKLNN